MRTTAMHRWLCVPLLFIFLAGCRSHPPAPPVPASRPGVAATAHPAAAVTTTTEQPVASHSASAPVAAKIPAASQAASRPESPRVIHPFPDVAVILSEAAPARVEIAALTCTPEYPLEQIVCAPATREHESLLVVKAAPSQIHAALLMAGFNPGSPGRWTYENDTLGTIAPVGDKVDVRVRFPSPGKPPVEAPIRDWIRDINGREDFPNQPWVFGGSRIAKNPKFMGEGEHYVADMTGSIIGLVTFGDEVLGFAQVISDSADIQAPEWEARTDVMPPTGTPVTLVLVKHAP